MKYDDFLGQVQARAHLPDRASAELVSRAFLSTLADRLEIGAAENLAGQLPLELADELRSPAHAELEKLSLDEFFARVSERERARLPDAVHHARAVLEVLGEAVGRSSMDKLRQQLPQEYGRLFVSREPLPPAGEAAPRAGETSRPAPPRGKRAPGQGKSSGGRAAGEGAG